jgi:hypothetical protein
MIARGRTTLSAKEVMDSVSEVQLLAHYLNVTHLPCVISSPFRKDEHPSFSLFSPDGSKVRYRDFATGEAGDFIGLLCRLWNKSFREVLNEIHGEHAPKYKLQVTATQMSQHSTYYAGNTTIKVKIRDWEKHDLDYWGSYGVPQYMLKAASVYPISHFFVCKEHYQQLYKADRFAYAYVENKEGRCSIKVYQPYNKGHLKWLSTHDKSVIGLWCTLPKKGNRVVICSSVKDALCLTASTGIPALSLQGEAYPVSKTAQEVLKSRFKKVFICLDNDKPGREDAKKLAEQTGFTNVELPAFKSGKDISDLYRALNDPDLFRETLIKLFDYD